MTPGPGLAIRGGGGLLVVAPLWLWWSVDRGGYPRAVWMPGLLALALATAVVLVLRRGPPLRGSRAVAVAALACWAVAHVLSILVSADHDLAWLTSERALLYALAFALPVLWPPTLAGLKAGLALWVVATLAALALGLAHARLGSAIDGRLTDPTTYPNATGALLLMGAVPALMLACLPRCPVAQRALGLAAAGTLAGGALLTQSRGILIVGAVVAAGAVALSPARLRLAAGGLCVVAAVAWQHHGLLDMRHLIDSGAPVAGVASAVRALATIAAVLAVAGLASSTVLRRVTIRGPSPRALRALRRAATASAVAAFGAVTVVGAAAGARPSAWASERLQDFRTPDYHRVEMGASRFGGGLGSNRYDYWRVAADSAAAHPLLGTGAGSFGATYLERRRTAQTPAYAHELWLGTAAEVGLGGLAALLTFVAAAAIALWRGMRVRTPEEAGTLLAAAAPLAVLLAHASGDWTFAFAGLAVPALALAGGALAPVGRVNRKLAHRRSSLTR